MNCTDALNKARAAAAELAFSGYDFGLLITDSGSWAETHTDDWVRFCYGEDDHAAERYRVVLNVRFEKGSAKPVEVYALDLKTGAHIGSASAVDAPPAEKPKTYNHAFTIAFSVPGSKTEDGEDVTAEQMAAALRLRIKDLMSNGEEMLEAVGAPYDTYEEQ